MMGARAPATEFPPDLDWVNVDPRPRLADLRGRVALLWFWSYDAVNCWNLVPDLRRLEAKHHDGLTVLGVHCPKYPHQRESEAVLHAVNRLGLRHPVASDPQFRLWQAYAIEAWPSVALVDAEGRLAALFAGEGRHDEIDVRVTELLEEAALHDLRVYEPSPPASRPEPRHALAFPGRLLVDADRLYVADSGHHRVLECRDDGRVKRQFGSGNAAFNDGSASAACFDNPQGLARWRDGLYVADSGNHSIRRIDLGDGSVTTVLGIGRAGRSRPERADPRATALNTPLDLCVVGDRLFVAVAGQNQIWRLDLARERVSVHAGSGELGRVDGDAGTACFAQPSGLVASGRQLIVADAAASALRLVGVDDGRTETLIGRDLYEFGDAIGLRDEVRLQNPLGVAADARGTIFVADSYNQSIKRVDCSSGVARALCLQHRLDEPQGLALTAGHLWIANTNRHEIVCVDPETGVARRLPVGEE
ncbi:MAG: redoxin family protein [Lysobacterales bacterium]